MGQLRKPTGHPISPEKAKELFASPLADVYRSILRTSCAPLFWYARDRHQLGIHNNGTVTFLKTPDRLIGVTAAHVIRGYLAAADSEKIVAQIYDARIDDLKNRIISVSDRLDIATFAVDNDLLRKVGKEIIPLENWPPRPPQEGCGIMLAGFPAVERRGDRRVVEFGLFTALVIARTVTDLQITWLIEPDAQLPNASIPPPPPRYGMGGISGGPLVTWLESDNYIATFALGGIINEHPN